MIPAIAHHNVVDSDDREEDGALMRKRERVKMSECHAILKDRSYRREGEQKTGLLKPLWRLHARKVPQTKDVHRRRGGYTEQMAEGEFGYSGPRHLPRKNALMYMYRTTEAAKMKMCFES